MRPPTGPRRSPSPRALRLLQHVEPEGRLGATSRAGPQAEPAVERSLAEARATARPRAGPGRSRAAGRGRRAAALRPTSPVIAAGAPRARQAPSDALARCAGPRPARISAQSIRRGDRAEAEQVGEERPRGGRVEAVRCRIWRARSGRRRRRTRRGCSVRAAGRGSRGRFPIVPMPFRLNHPNRFAHRPEPRARGRLRNRLRGRGEDRDRTRATTRSSSALHVGARAPWRSSGRGRPGRDELPADPALHRALEVQRGGRQPHHPRAPAGLLRARDHVRHLGRWRSPPFISSVRARGRQPGAARSRRIAQDVCGDAQQWRPHPTPPTSRRGAIPTSSSPGSGCASRRSGPPPACRSARRPFVAVGRTPTTREATMRFMVIVKANEDSEAGVMPSEELLTEMGRYNEELVKAGVMLAGEGLQPSSKGARVAVLREGADGDRRALRRDQGADRRLLALPGQVDGRGHRVGRSAARTRWRASRRSRSARSSRPRTSATAYSGEAREVHERVRDTHRRAAGVSRAGAPCHVRATPTARSRRSGGSSRRG